MLDPKLYTFMLLAKCKSTTECAQIMHVTQPAVSQHIKALEAQYGVSFFVKEGRRLVLTEQGRRFEILCRRLCTLDEQITQEMHQPERADIRFGATLSIAEGLMPGVLPRLIEEFPRFQFHMMQQNTHSLLSRLENGEIDFALIEGNFDHKRYHYKPFFISRFVGLCQPNSPFSHITKLSDTLQACLILREKGSGTRDIFEGECKAHNLSVTDFSGICEIEHIPTLLSLVAAGKGITFAYETAAESLLSAGVLQIMELEDFHLERPFHFVSLPSHPRAELLDEIAGTIQSFTTPTVSNFTL